MNDMQQIQSDPRLTEIAEFGFQFMDTPDLRTLPCADQIDQGLRSITEGVTALFEQSRLEDETGPILWQIINIFQRQVERAERDLDANELEQRQLHLEQDGSEVKSVELENATLSGQNLVEKRNVYEVMRDTLADLYQVETGSVWRPAAGRKVNHSVMTAAILDSSDFIAARKREDEALNLPAGTYIGFAGVKDYNDVAVIERILDRTLAKYPDMVLLHTGSKSGADKIADLWAGRNGVTSVPFNPDWNKHGNTAPFKRNDALLSTGLKGLIVIPANGITKNIAQKAQAKAISTFTINAPA